MNSALLKAQMPGFVGGEVTEHLQGGLAPYQCHTAENVVCLPNGWFRVRHGTKKITPTALGGTILSGYRYYNPSNGDRKTFVQITNEVYEVSDAGAATRVAHPTTGGPLLKYAYPLQWKQCFATGKLLAANGRLYEFDGTDWTIPNAADIPKVWRFTENLEKIHAIPIDDRSKIYRSPAQTVDSAWPATDYSPLQSVRGDKIVDLLTLGNWILALKDQSCWRIDGSTIYDLAKSLQSEQTGCIGRAALTYEGVGMWFSPQGLWYFNEASEVPFINISRNKVNDQLLLLDRNNLNGAFATFWAKEKLYLLCIPSYPGGGKTIWAVHLDVAGPEGGLLFPITRWVMPFGVSAMWTQEGEDDNSELILADRSGNFYECRSGLYSDDGADIDFEVETALSPLIALGENRTDVLVECIKNVREMILPVRYKGGISVDLVADYDPAKTQTITTGSYAQENALIWNESDWGSPTIWPGPHAPVEKHHFMGFTGRLIGARFYGSVNDRCEVGYPLVRYAAIKSGWSVGL